MLDRYTWGNVERVSPEAPVMVLRADESEVRLGGAASVATLLRHLVAQVTLAGVIGEDVDGRTVRRVLMDESIDDEIVVVDSNRSTTTKERFLGRASNRHPHQMLRVDRETSEAISDDLAQVIADRLTTQMSRFDAVLISDYDKGFCTPCLVQAIIASACHFDIPVVVDPARIADFGRYRGNCVITPNRLEAELATGLRIRTPKDALAIGSMLCEQFALRAAMVTLDRDGIALAESCGTTELIPAKAREVYDITGAGDMVLAVVGLCLAGGIELHDAARIANAAAGCEVEKLGVAPITLAEIQAEFVEMDESSNKQVSLEELRIRAESYRRYGKKIVFTNGCFDLLHVGHVTYLQQAAELGDILVVAINSDASVRALKGTDRPVINHQNRAAMLAAVGCVDYVIVFSEATPHKLLRQIRPDVLVKGGTTAKVVGREVVEQYGGNVHVLGRVDFASTTEIVSSIRTNT